MTSKTQVARAVQAVSRATAEAKRDGHLSERRWWHTQLRKLVREATELHGPGSVVSSSQLEQLLDKRGGDV